MKKMNPYGFTIVEIIVASVVLALSLTATVSMVRKAQELSSLDQHRRKARGFIDGQFETSTYQQLNYYNLNPKNKSPDTNFTSTITIDSTSSAVKIQGKLKTSISVLKNLTNAGVNYPYKIVTISVAWKEYGVKGTAPADSEKVTIEKWISP
jgi:prepilin-type N-terminal cleavage/methylation domain-containing protein